MEKIRRKVFVGPTLYFGFKSLNHYRDKIRDIAENFINNEIGLDRLVSISEHVTSNGPFSIAVWYKADDHVTSTSQVVSNAGLK